MLIGETCFQPVQINFLLICYLLRIKIIRKECQKKWPGNSKIYFRSNNNNSLVLSELVSSLQAACELPEIGFGQGEDKNFSFPQTKINAIETIYQNSLMA